MKAPLAATQRKRHVTVVVGTRPEAIKLAPIVQALRADPRADVELCLTGQHRELLDPVLDLFELSADVDLRLMRPAQTLSGFVSSAIASLDTVFRHRASDWVLVQGDTASAYGGAVAAFHLGRPVAHIEAGLRTGDLNNPFPEEAYRRMISCLATLHLAPTTRAQSNLLAEGIDRRSVQVIGNTVIDAVQQIAARSDFQSNPVPSPPDGVRRILLTVHRRENHGAPLERILSAARRLLIVHEGKIQIVVPVHPNPAVAALVHEHLDGLVGALIIEPLRYDHLVAILKTSYLVLTDSGGIQEEAPGLAKPVLVLRDATERPEGIDAGVARLVGTDGDVIVAAVGELLEDHSAYRQMAQAVNPYGDGHAAERAVEAMLAGGIA